MEGEGVPEVKEGATVGDRHYILLEYLCQLPGAFPALTGMDSLAF